MGVKVSELFRFANLAAFPGLIHGISDRSSGSVYAEKARGRQRLAEALGIAVDALVPTRQVHADEVVRVPGPRYGCWGGQRGADGLITATPGIFLLGFFADCVPILAYDPVRRAVGLVHAGWRGTLLGIAGRLVKEMVAAFCTRPQELVVGVGPSVGPCCYEVGAEVLDVLQRLPGGDGLLRPGRPGHAYLDLWEANRQVLLHAGVPSVQIEVAGLCTACNVERFYSYRREGKLNGLFGAVVGLEAGSWRTEGRDG